jgi:cellulose synthase/poly-beta-1,6-N-acetylglucosamine synthase-like glycosyltransferase
MGLTFLVGLFMPARRVNSSKPFVSVIIAARNEEKNIARCLEHLVRQTYSQELFEIIVVNDRSDDATTDIVSEFAAKYKRIRCVGITEKSQNISGKKNALSKGIADSKGDILLFTDADCVVKESWIENMVGYFSEDVGAVIGFSAIESKTLFERWQEYDFLSLMAAACGITNIGFPLAASGQNLAYRRKAFDAAGGFEKVKERISGDDTLMIQLIRKHTAYRIVFASDPGTFNSTQPMDSLTELIHQRSRWASNGTIMLQLNPLFFIYLVSVYALHIQLFAGLLLGVIYPSVLIMTVFAWITKLVVDFAVSHSGVRVFRKKFSFAIFLLWFILQTPLILVVGFKGALGYFKWK